MPWVYPVAEEDVGRLCAPVRPQTDDAFECCSAQKVRPGLAFYADAVDGQLLNEFSPSQGSLACKHIADNAGTSCARILVQSQFGTPSPTARNKHRTKEWQEPAQVLCCQQVERASLAPCADDRTLLHARTLDIGSDQPGTANTQRERCSTRILCLDTT